MAEAYRRLTNILQRNKVRPQLRLAERHEKKGEKRRRLSSERWRKRFAHEVSQISITESMSDPFTIGPEKSPTCNQNSQSRSIRTASYIFLKPPRKSYLTTAEMP